MNKIKKSIALVAALLLMSSNINANTKAALADNCFGESVFVFDNAIRAGASQWQAFVLASAAFDTCVENMQ